MPGHALGGTPGGMGISQPGIPVPPSRRGGMVAALIAVSIGIVGAASFGAYLLVRSPETESDPPLLSTGTPVEEPSAETPPPPDPEPKKPPEPEPEAEPEPDPAPKPTPKLPPPPPAQPRPLVKAPPPPPPKTEPTKPKDSTGGRKIKTEL
ncbi:MAG TPA: hypothetical protein VFB62_19260 [Polyangiaceae bacterium]|nr:hypothetical protein [Polyangiaceae bacterium]